MEPLACLFHALAPRLLAFGVGSQESRRPGVDQLSDRSPQKKVLLASVLRAAAEKYVVSEAKEGMGGRLIDA